MVLQNPALWRDIGEQTALVSNPEFAAACLHMTPRAGAPWIALAPAPRPQSRSDGPGAAAFDQPPGGCGLDLHLARLKHPRQLFDGLPVARGAEPIAEALPGLYSLAAASARATARSSQSSSSCTSRATPTCSLVGQVPRTRSAMSCSPAASRQSSTISAGGISTLAHPPRWGMVGPISHFGGFRNGIQIACGA